jgi:hypothetical protein
MDRWLPRKLTILGMSSVLSLPIASMPPSLTASIPQLIDGVVRMSISLKEDEQKKGGEGENSDILAAEHALNNDIGDLDQGFGEDEDVTNEVDESYRKALQGVTSWDDDMARFLLGGDWDEDSEDVDEDFTSPLTDNSVDELLFLSDVLTGAFQRESEVSSFVYLFVYSLSVVVFAHILLLRPTNRYRLSCHLRRL